VKFITDYDPQADSIGSTEVAWEAMRNKGVAMKAKTKVRLPTYYQAEVTTTHSAHWRLDVDP
jgi:hypothetical protein